VETAIDIMEVLVKILAELELCAAVILQEETAISNKR